MTQNDSVDRLLYIYKSLVASAGRGKLPTEMKRLAREEFGALRYYYSRKRGCGTQIDADSDSDYPSSKAMGTNDSACDTDDNDFTEERVDSRSKSKLEKGCQEKVSPHVSLKHVLRPEE